MSGQVYFGSFLVTRQVALPHSICKQSYTFTCPCLTFKKVFHLTPLSFALVNLKPLLPGHVLVSPRRVVPRFSDLSHAEVVDLFVTVQRVARMIERVYTASSLNIAVQDGADAGQSVPHLHTHIIPRKKADMDTKGGGDAIYSMLEGEEGDIGKELQSRRTQRSDFHGVNNENRQPRSEEVMAQEAEKLALEMDADQIQSS